MDNEFDDEFKVLCESYGKSLPEKSQEIRTTLNNLKITWTMKDILHLSSLVHKLAGSAGIYGYTLIGEKAAALEHFISRFDNVAPSTDEIAQIDTQVAAIENLVSQKTSAPTITLQVTETNLVYLLNDDSREWATSNWSKKLVQQADIFGYKIVVFNDINTLFSALNQKNPIALLINFDLLSNPFIVNLSDTNIQDILTLYFKKIYTIFIAKSGEFDKRLAAVRMGCKSYLVTPFSTDALITELDNLKFLWNGMFKAIVIDDDPLMTSYHAGLLNAANIETRTLNSPSNIEKELHDFQPDIILMDLNMPECNGIELASVIRQQKSYEDIPIVFLSTEENRHKQLEAMSVGADDFITKATDANTLIHTVRIKASRYKKIKAILVKDNLTGAFNFRYMTRQLEKLMETFKTTQKTFVICITSVDNFNNISQSNGYSASDQLIANLYVLLNNQLDVSTIIGNYTPEKFLLIFPNNTQEQATEEMKKIQDKFHSTLQYADGKAFASTFSIGLTTYKTGETIDQLIAAAETDLVDKTRKSYSS